MTSGSGPSGIHSSPRPQSQSASQGHSQVAAQSMPQPPDYQPQVDMEPVLQELEQNRDQQRRLREIIENLKVGKKNEEIVVNHNKLFQEIFLSIPNMRNLFICKKYTINIFSDCKIVRNLYQHLGQLHFRCIGRRTGKLFYGSRGLTNIKFYECGQRSL